MACVCRSSLPSVIVTAGLEGNTNQTLWHPSETLLLQITKFPEDGQEIAEQVECTCPVFQALSLRGRIFEHGRDVLPLDGRRPLRLDPIAVLQQRCARGSHTKRHLFHYY